MHRQFSGYLLTCCLFALSCGNVQVQLFSAPKKLLIIHVCNSYAVLMLKICIYAGIAC